MDWLSILEVKLINTSHQILPSAQPSITPDIASTPDPTPKSLAADRLESLLQMQKTDPPASRFLNDYQMEKHLKYETELFIHVKGLLFKHITDSGQKFLP